MILFIVFNHPCIPGTELHTWILFNSFWEMSGQSQMEVLNLNIFKPLTILSLEYFPHSCILNKLPGNSYGAQQA